MIYTCKVEFLQLNALDIMRKLYHANKVTLTGSGVIVSGSSFGGDKQSRQSPMVPALLKPCTKKYHLLGKKILTQQKERL